MPTTAGLLRTTPYDSRMSECDCCGKTGGNLWATKTYYGADWQLHRCGQCGFAYVWPRPSAALINAFYEEHGGHGRALATTLTPHDILERERASAGSTLDASRIASRICELLAARGSRDRGSRHLKLLDVGCGYGFFTCAARDAGFDVTALEMSEHEATVALGITGIEPIRSSFEEYDTTKTFDAVLMSQVLEHALSPSEWVAKAHRLLAPGGILAIAVPNFGGVFRRLLGVRDFMIIPPAHLNYFDPNSLTQMLVRHGFTDVRVDHVTRVPRDTIRRRLGSSPVVVAVVERISKALCAVVDTAKIGGIINLYATRP